MTVPSLTPSKGAWIAQLTLGVWTHSQVSPIIDLGDLDDDI